MVHSLLPKTDLEQALDKLDLQGILVLMAILSQKAIMMQQNEARKARVDKLMKPDTAIKIPTAIHKPIEQ